MDFFSGLQQMGPALEQIETRTVSISDNLERIATALEGIRQLLADEFNYGMSEQTTSPLRSDGTE